MDFAAPDPDPTLVERAGELAVLDDVLARAGAGEGRLAVLEGPPGIGKTRLLRAARERAAAAGTTVLAAVGSDLEADFAHGVVRQLFEPVAGDAGLFDGPARLARPALGVGTAAEGAGGAFAAAHGTFWLCVNLAARAPVLVAVDDLQWADPASQRCLAYLARRLEGLRVALVVAVRPVLPGEGRAAVDALVGDPRAELLRPAPLSPSAVALVVRARLGAAADPAFSAACHAATAGNPLWLREVLADLRGAGVAPGAATALDVDRLGPERVSRNVRGRIEALGADAEALARAVAVLGDGHEAGTAGALAGLGPPRAVQAAVALTAADVLADDPALRFAHPVVRAAVRDGVPEVERAALHGVAARLLGERGAPVAQIAGHLTHAPAQADPWAVARLREAARATGDQGAPAAAAALLRRALVEPPEPQERPALLRELGAAELAVGEPDGVEHLQAALAGLTDTREHALATLELSAALYQRLRTAEAADALRRGLERLDGRDAELELLLEAELALAARMRLDGSDAAVQRLRDRAARLTGATPAERWVLATVAVLAPADTAAHHARAAELLERATATGLPVEPPIGTGIVSNLLRAGRLDAAWEACERRLADAVGRGAVTTQALMLSMRGWIELERGDLPAAEADLRAALDVVLELEAPAAPAAGMLAQAVAEQGRGDDAERLLTEHGLTGELPPHQAMNPILMARARVRLARNEPDQALEDLLEIGRRYAAWNIRRAVPPWRSLAAILLRDDDAPRARELAHEELELSHRWGAPAAIGLAERGVGLVEGDASRLEAAVAALETTPARLELARALVDLGALRRRTRRRAAARDPLRRGLDLAHRSGAVLLAERARAELLATGARPRRAALSGVEALTASERRVAQLAARGLTNRGIAQELFVTPATVETHLRAAFMKLDVARRGELAAALAPEREVPGAPLMRSG